MIKIRYTPIICLLVGIIKLLTGQLNLSDNQEGTEYITKQGNVFRIFRNISSRNKFLFQDTVVFIVNLKFANLSHKTNKKISIIPILLIAGHPGFVEKLYAVNEENGYWQGIYEWKSKQDLDAFKQSFVYRMMKKRALSHSIKEEEFFD